jgi:hypothetical protein
MALERAVLDIRKSIEPDIFVRVFAGGSTGCSNASTREGIIHERVDLHGLSLNFRELALKQTDLGHCLYFHIIQEL